MVLAEFINKMYVYNKLLLRKKKNSQQTPDMHTTWIKLLEITLYKSQISKRTCCIISVKKAKLIYINRDQPIIAWVGVEMGEKINWDGGLRELSGMMEMSSCLYWGVGYMDFYTCPTHQIIYLRFCAPYC